MRRGIRIAAILTLLGLGIYGYIRHERPKVRVKAPTTRFHGYELNHKAIEKAKHFTVLISNEGFDGVGRGTGVLLDSTHVLTCAHMLNGSSEPMWIYPYPGEMVVKGSPVWGSKRDDLLVLELDRKVEIDEYATFQSEHYDGEPITIIGNTKGAMHWFVTFGIVSGEWDGFLLTDGVLYGGNSGGPWINEKGEIVALTDWTLLNRDGSHSEIHGGVPASKIHKFLKQWKEPDMLGMIQMMLGGM